MPDPLPYQDFTLKAAVADVAAMEKTLRDIHATWVGVDHQKGIYFKVAHGKLKWRQGNIENLITHYERVVETGMEKTIVYRYDLNPTPDQIAKLLATHKEIGTIEKERKIYTIGNVKIHLDKTKGGDLFIEIEAIDREGVHSRELLRRQCLEVKTKLGITDTDLVRTGYWVDGMPDGDSEVIS